MCEDEYVFDAVRALRSRIQILEPERDELLSSSAGYEPVYDLTFRCSECWPLLTLEKFCASLRCGGCLEWIDDEKGEIWELFVPYVKDSKVDRMISHAQRLNDAERDD